MLMLKLILVPGLLALVTLAARRWGPTRGGVLAGMPWVVGPILLVLLLERGGAFAAQASTAAFLSVPASATLLLVLAHASRRFALPTALGLGVLGWLVVGVAFVQWLPPLWLAVAINLGLLLALPQLLPRFLEPAAGNDAAHSAAAAGSVELTTARLNNRAEHLDLMARMIAGAVLTLLVSALAGALGSEYSGALAAFPIITVVLGAMSWISYGAGYMVEMFRGMTLGYFSLATFSLALAVLLDSFAALPAFLGACLATAVVHGIAVILAGKGAAARRA